MVDAAIRLATPNGSVTLGDRTVFLNSAEAALKQATDLVEELAATQSNSIYPSIAQLSIVPASDVETAAELLRIVGQKTQAGQYREAQKLLSSVIILIKKQDQDHLCSLLEQAKHDLEQVLGREAEALHQS